MTADDLGTDDRVTLHCFPFLFGESAGLEQNVVWNADLSDVVHRCGQLQHFGLRLRNAGGKGKPVAILAHAHNVQSGFIVAILAGNTQPADDLDSRLLEFPSPLAHALLKRQILIVQFEMNPHPLKNDRRVAWLVQIVDCAQQQTDLFVARITLRGEKDDGYALRTKIRLQAPTGLVAVHHGHHDIQQDQARLWRFQRRSEGFLPVGGKGDSVLRTQNIGQITNVLRHVVNHQNGLIGFLTHCPASLWLPCDPNSL